LTAVGTSDVFCLAVVLLGSDEGLLLMFVGIIAAVCVESNSEIIKGRTTQRQLVWS